MMRTTAGWAWLTLLTLILSAGLLTSPESSAMTTDCEGELTADQQFQFEMCSAHIGCRLVTSIARSCNGLRKILDRMPKSTQAMDDNSLDQTLSGGQGGSVCFRQFNYKACKAYLFGADDNPEAAATPQPVTPMQVMPPKMSLREAGLARKALYDEDDRLYAELDSACVSPTANCMRLLKEISQLEEKMKTLNQNREYLAHLQPLRLLAAQKAKRLGWEPGQDGWVRQPPLQTTGKSASTNSLSTNNALDTRQFEKSMEHQRVALVKKDQQAKLQDEAAKQRVIEEQLARQKAAERQAQMNQQPDSVASATGSANHPPPRGCEQDRAYLTTQLKLVDSRMETFNRSPLGMQQQDAVPILKVVLWATQEYSQLISRYCPSDAQFAALKKQMEDNHRGTKQTCSSLVRDPSTCVGVAPEQFDNAQAQARQSPATQQYPSIPVPRF